MLKTALESVRGGNEEKEEWRLRRQKWVELREEEQASCRELKGGSLEEGRRREGVASGGMEAMAGGIGGEAEFRRAAA